ncbi:MAG TPA: DUF3160 domain-containing protein [Candidatus Xenobia bacterium]|jgi:hypothetical protein
MKKIAPLALALLVILAPAQAKPLYRLDDVLNARSVPEWRDKAVARSLESNGFVILQDQPGDTYRSHWRHFYEMYESLRYEDRPAFITSDAIMHYGHEYFDFSLEQVERHALVDLQSRMLDTLTKATRRQMRTAPSPAWRQAARANLAFLSVASALLDPHLSVPAEVSTPVRQELKLIVDASGPAASPLLGHVEDYSQYKPRGHYTDSETLERYFRAQMWLGRAYLSPKSPAALRQAALLTLAMNGPGFALWDRFDRVVAWFVGDPASVGPRQYQDLMHRVWGRTPSMVDLLDGGRIKTFQHLALKPGDLDPAFRLAGQRYVADSHILSQLCYPKVPQRSMVSGQDVMAALGSALSATVQLKSESHYPPYAAHLRAMQHWVAALPSARWTSNAYWSWLDAMRTLFQVPAHAPSFMHTPAWAAKSLNTALSAWTELRHDTILYAQSTYAEGGEGRHFVPMVLAKGYVEPQPEVYHRLGDMCRRTRLLLEQEGLLPPSVRDVGTLYETTVRRMEDISNEELSGSALSLDDYNVIREFGRVMEQVHKKVEPKPSVGGTEGASMALVADVHTDLRAGLCLEEGVGLPQEVVALVPIDGHLVAVRGAVFSHYEFTSKDRLDDHEWEAQVSSKPPPRSAWLAAATATLGPSVSHPEDNDPPWTARAANLVVRSLRQISWGRDGDTSPSISPSGGQVLFATRQGGHSQVFIGRSDGSDQMALTPPDLDADIPCWLPFECKFAFRQSGGNVTLYDYQIVEGGRGERDTGPQYPYQHGTRRIFSGLSAGATMRAFDVKPAGGADYDRDERILISDGARLSSLDPATIGPWSHRSPRSPSLSVIRAGEDGDAASNGNVVYSDGHDIYLTDVSGRKPTALTHGGGHNRFPTWSPNKAMVAFVSDRDGHDHIWVMNADGTSPVRLTQSLESDTAPVWHEASEIVFVSRRHGGVPHLWCMQLGAK